MKKPNCVFLLLGLLAISPSLLTAQEVDNDDADECALYLAESSIKNAGWGVFAGKKFALGDKIGEPGVGVHVMDTHNVRDNGALSEFVKSAATIGGGNEADQVFTFLPGIHSLANHHRIMSNVFESGLTKTTTDRYSDPLAGSYSSYHGFTYIATEVITQGQEIFTTGTEEWFEQAGISTEDDYRRANGIIISLLDYDKKFPDVSEAQWIDIFHRLKEEMIQTPGVAKLIPKTQEGLLNVASSTIEEVALEPRDWKWVKENGYCLDYVREGPSTIVGAGRGAFATRKLEKGDVITPVPLTQLVDRSALDTEDATNATSQLLLNYCFGHRKSKLLLCPTTHLTLINHNSKNPNAAIRWTKPSQNRLDMDTNYRTEALDSMAVDSPELKSSFNTKLAFEVVATRDIEDGEELFLDYGSEWAAALETHKKQWSPPTHERISSARELNEANAPISLSKDLPPQYTHECRIEPMAFERKSPNEEGEDYLSNPDVSQEHWNYHMHILYDDNAFIRWHPCNILAVNDDETFRAEVYSKRLVEKQVKMRTVRNMPREAIQLTDNRYYSDQHLKSAFRHYIPIPDSMFPLRWRDDYRTAASWNLGKRAEGIDLTMPENKDYHDRHEEAARSASCGVYFAPSNIPHAGFGTYTALPLAGRGVVVGTSMPVIPVFGGWPRQWNGDDYVWASRTYNAEYESAGVPAPLSLTSVMAVNDGALANSHLGLVNEYVSASVFDPMLDRCKDPGAGASSDYVNYSFKSEFALGQGEELFVHYGEKWFTGREQFADVPVTKNWDDSNFILASVWSLSNLENAELDDRQTLELLDVIKKSAVEEHRTGMALDTVTSIDGLSRVVERNGAAQATMEVRTPEWFEKHGQCLDHVYVKRSTIPQAGNGGFARRTIKEGNIVISSPLMTTFGEDMFHLGNERANETMVGSKINDKLIFLNYQFSHPQSSVYFFPINHGYIFNHRSERMDDGSKPNAELRWATWSTKSSYYLQRTLEDLEKEHYSTIVLDVVATRNIEVDEEVLIDYGVEWEEAWKSHVENWKSPCDEFGVMSSRMVKRMNDKKFNDEFHPWSDDHFTVCWVNNDEVGEFVHAIKEDEIVPPQSQHKATTSFRGIIDWDHPGFEYSLIADGTFRFPCIILNADKNNQQFDVAIFRCDIPSKIAELPKARILQIHNGISADDVEFINRPFRGDMHWKDAFRHPIKIPDDIFPPQWKDLASKY